jgi:hypothetical protein
MWNQKLQDLVNNKLPAQQQTVADTTAFDQAHGPAQPIDEGQKVDLAQQAMNKYPSLGNLPGQSVMQKTDITPAAAQAGGYSVPAPTAPDGLDLAKGRTLAGLSKVGQLDAAGGMGFNGNPYSPGGANLYKEAQAQDKEAQDAKDKMALEKEKIAAKHEDYQMLDQTRREIASLNASNKGGGSLGANTYNLSPEENAALNDALVNGLDPYQINSRTAKIYAQQELINPGRKWNELGAQAKFERSTGTMTSKALINSVTPLFDNLLSAGKDLGNSNVQFMNKAINFAKEAAGDPKIVQFNNQRDDIVAEVERGLLGSGVLSDTKYMRAIKNVNSAQSYPQLEAAVRATKLIINARLHALKQGPNPDAGANVESGNSGVGSSTGGPPASAATMRYNPQTGKIEPIGQQ